MKKKKINFTQIEVENFDGNKRVYDISKELGNGIFTETTDLGEFELAREIHKAGEAEIDEAQAAFLSRFIRENFKAFVQANICPVLDNLFNNNQN